MTIYYMVCLAVLTLATLLVVVRIERGPSVLDRAVAVDVVTSALIGFIAIFSAMQRRTDLIHLMAALAIVGFLSTVTISRFAGSESDEERRILTAEEEAQLLLAEMRLDDDAAPVHDVDAVAELAEGILPEDEVAGDAQTERPAAAGEPDGAARRPSAAEQRARTLRGKGTER